MKIALLIIITIIAGLLLGPFIQQIPGSLVLVFSESTVQMRLWQAIVMLVAAGLVFVFLYHLMVRIWHTAGWLKNWRGSRRGTRSRRKTLQGLVALHEGDWRKAEKLLVSAGRDSDTALINYLAAAEASQNLSDYERRDQYLQQAILATPEAVVAVSLIQARYQQQSDQLESALATLNHVLQMAPNQALALLRMCDLYQQLGEWQEATKLLPQLKQSKLLSENQKSELEISLTCGTLQAVTQQGGIEALQSTWLGLPKALRKNGTVEFLYLKLLVDNHAVLEAEKLIQQRLIKQGGERYLLLYGKLQSENPAKQLAFVEKVAPQFEQSFAWYMTAGRLCLRQQLWGKAKAYLEQCREIKETQEVLGLLGLAYEATGDTQAAYDSFKLAHTKHIS